MKENSNKTTVETMNIAPNIEMGILKRALVQSIIPLIFGASVFSV